MKDLINNIITFLETAITAGDITATKVFKGLDTMPETIPIEAYPYIAIDDGGERVEDLASGTSNRIYSVVFEMGVYVSDTGKSLDDILTLADEVKTTLELEANRLKDGHIWGINITPFQLEDATKKIFRGRVVTVDYMETEFRDYDRF